MALQADNAHARSWKQRIKSKFSRIWQAPFPAYVPKEFSHKLDPNWINLNDLREWIHVCDTEHGNRCKLQQLTPGRPLWLIDVQLQCIVSAAPDSRYIALSYVWGQVTCAMATKDNLNELVQEGSLAEENEGIIIPRTIRHTMRLVELMGERFLWVDRLCISQDDEESKHMQLANMADIYANAYLTIIAANGWDAEHGLRGIQDVTEPRQISPNFENNYYESLQPYSSVWYDRGWTFQELAFSRRKIMFQYQVAIWECACNVWHEGTGISGTPPAYSEGESEDPRSDDEQEFRITPWRKSFDLKFWPDLFQYLRMIQNYNMRQLTYPDDGLAAFSGVLSTLSRTFTGGFICGLPQMFFDVALLWQPFTPLNRRSSRNNDTSMLPSWSWIDPTSWTSGLHYAYQNIAISRKDYEISSTTVPICEWEYYDGSTLRKVEATYQKYQDSDWEITGILPPGWSRRLYSTAMAVPNAGKIPRFYHESDPRVHFYHPVPKANPDAPLPVRQPGPLLYTRTSRGFYQIGPEIEPYGLSWNYYCETRFIRDEKGNNCGVLRIPVTLSSSDLENESQCEVIAISAGLTPTVSRDAVLEEWASRLEFHDETGPPSEISEYYNVLWIQWKDGIAYREALGRIFKESWENHPTELIDVTLG